MPIVRLPEGARRLALQPIFPDQAADARAARRPACREGGPHRQRPGLFELTGYSADIPI